MVKSGVNGAGFAYCRMRSEVSFKNGYAAGMAEWFLNCLDDFGIFGISELISLKVLLNRLSCTCHKACVKDVAKSLHYSGDTACSVEVLHIPFSRGIYLRDLRSRLVELSELTNNVHTKLSLVGDGAKMENGVCGAADSHCNFDGVSYAFLCDYLTSRNSFVNKVNNGASGHK